MARLFNGSTLCQIHPVHYALRPCTASDYDWAYALKCDAYRDIVERQFGPWDEAFQRALFTRRWNPTRAQIVLVDGEPVGFLNVENRPADEWIDEIQVVRAWRGRGLGTALLRDLIARATADRKPLRLQVLKGNPRAHALYLRLGFTPTARRRRTISWNSTHGSASPRRLLPRVESNPGAADVSG